ncbi:MAG: acetoacetate decarboxylase family protein [Alphaproteobacteria bacterium]
MELARNIVIEFEPDPEAAAAAVPDPLVWEPGTMALAVIGDNRQMPTSQIFQEGIVYLKVRFGEQVGNFIPYIWTSTDEAMLAAREMSGRPKTLCDHNQLEIMGSQARAVITRRGETLMRCSITLERPATERTSRSPATRSRFVRC